MRRRPPRTLPSKGRGREWTTGTGEAAPRRALDPKPRVRTNLTLRWWMMLDDVLGIVGYSQCTLVLSRPRTVFVSSEDGHAYM